MNAYLKHRGFTLIELLVCLTIICILTIVSIVMYSSQIRSSRRADAVNTLYSISLAEERYRTINTTYGTLAQVWSGVTASTGGYYSIAISNVTATSYTITATALGTQVNDVAGSTSCSSLQLAMSGGTITRTPAACWPT